LSILDDIEQIRAADPDNMYNRIFDFPEQLAEGLKISKASPLNPNDFLGIKNIVVVGMGGSAIGGDIIRSYLRSKLLVPFEICRHYTLPEYVDDETLVIASSYSGNTEETLAAVNDALNRKAMIVAVGSGGMLGDLAKVSEIPMAVVPTGIAPRAALGYILVPMLMVFEKIGLMKNVAKDIEAATAGLQKHREKYIEDNAAATNPAKHLAEAIHGKMVVIYSGPTLTDPIGLRLKGQLCENAKVMAFANQFPEFNHNELVGWPPQIDAHKEHLTVILLRDMDDHAQVRNRMNIVSEIIKSREVEIHEIHSRGATALERILSLVQIGDFVSYYLAVLNKVDPTPVVVIEALKKALADSK